MSSFHDGDRTLAENIPSSGNYQFNGHSAGFLLSDNEDPKMTRSEVSLQIDFLQSSGALTSSNSEISNLNEDAWAELAILTLAPIWLALLRFSGSSAAKSTLVGQLFQQ